MPKKYSQVWIDKILAMTKKGHRVHEIHTWLRNCGVPMSKHSVWYYAKGLQKPRHFTRPKTTLEVRNLIHELTCEDDETCARDIRRILKDKYDVEISESSIRTVRRQMGWSYGRPRTSRMIRDGSKVKRKFQAKARMEKNQQFNDETSEASLPIGTNKMKATTNRKVLVRKENLPNSASKRKAKVKSITLHRTDPSLLETTEYTAWSTNVTEVPVTHELLPHSTEKVISDDGPFPPAPPIAPHIHTGHQMKSGRNLLAGDEAITGVQPSTNQNMCSAPNGSHHGPNFNPSPIVLPSQPFGTCRCGAQERLETMEMELKEIKEAISSMSQMVEETVNRAMSSVSEVVEKAVEKALCTMNLVVPHDVNTFDYSPPLQDTNQSYPEPSVKEEPEDYVNESSTSASENGQYLCGIPCAAESTVPLAVVAPVSDFTLPVVDSSTLDRLHETARNEPHRFAQLLFQELVPYDVYKTWTHTVNYDGSRGKRALPENLRNAIVQETQKYYFITTEIAKKIKDTLNAFLRMPRASRW
ncbi:uncharacterized protein LOC122932758 isoform X1 [Bufo gargarizans]|uniref:uncharacterized protein LOC122932758 isoform X1 n=1 Tax=Bufo gargarizans TaxID=30331 RepID=UPI001CF43A49|nr:uncharacterized protein LOC122932758 isoform X1 [Bufo gargarizans]